MVLVTIFTSSLFSSLTVILIYKISKYFTKNEKYRLLISITYGLGSLAFPYALILYTHATGTFFIFLTFYILFKIKQEKIKNYNYLFLSGLSMGLAFMFDFSTVFASIFLFFYMFSFNFYEKKNILIFLLGVSLGLLPFIFYNISILGLKLELIPKYNDREIFSAISEQVFRNYGVIVPHVSVPMRVLFDSYRGLLFYYPIFIISLLGLYEMRKAYKKEVLLILLIFISFIIYSSVQITWYGGYCFGPRFMLPAIPFLTIPILFVLNDLKINFSKLVVGILIIFSVFINFLSLQILEDTIIDSKTLLIAKEYQTRIETFQSLPNVVYQYYLPLFLKYGPRSMIFENIFEGSIEIDIRDMPLSKNWVYPYLSNNHVNFLSLVSLVVIIILI
jgi:hypothetical protein